MAAEKQALLALLAAKSFRLGEFKLSAGGTSDYYIDCRATTLDAEGARLTGRVPESLCARRFLILELEFESAYVVRTGGGCGIDHFPQVG